MLHIRNEPLEPTHIPVALSDWLREKGKGNSQAVQRLLSDPSLWLHRSADLVHKKVRRPLVAVVDDEAVIAVTLAELLARHGFEAVWFTSPLEALEFVKLVRIDLLLSDVQMPEISGMDLAKKLYELCEECPVLFLTADKFRHEAAWNMQAVRQPFHFAQKPIRIDELVVLMNSLLFKATADCL